MINWFLLSSIIFIAVSLVLLIIFIKPLTRYIVLGNELLNSSDTFFTKFSSKIPLAINAVSNILTSTIEETYVPIGKIIDKSVDGVVTVATTIAKVVPKILNPIADQLVDISNQTATLIDTVGKDVVKIIPVVDSIIVDVLDQTGKSIAVISPVIVDTLNIVADLVSTTAIPLKKVINQIPAITGVVVGVVSNLLTNITTTTSSIINKLDIDNTITAEIAKIGGELNTAVDSFTTTGTSAITAITGATAVGLNFINTATGKILNPITKVLTKLESIETVIQDVLYANPVYDITWLIKNHQKVDKAFKDLGKDVASGVTTAADAIAKLSTEVADDINNKVLDPIKNAFEDFGGILKSF